MVFKYRYELTPHMAEYDNIGNIWLPYLMYFHEPNYSSDVLNTDSRGFRVSHKNSKIISEFNNSENLPVSLLVGGSTAFGVGATNDANTIPSILNSKSDHLWLNFGGRAFGSTQEFLLFMFYFQQIKNIGKIVLFSGINNLILYYTSQNYSGELGSFFFSNQYRKKMSEITTAGKIKQSILKPFLGPNVNYNKLSMRKIVKLLLAKDPKTPLLKESKSDFFYKKILDHGKEKNNLLPIMRRDIFNWRLIARALQTELCYVLQPFADWTQKKLSKEEELLFSELDKRQPSFRAIKNKMDQEQHLWFSTSLRQVCDNCGVPFFDMNEDLQNRQINEEWLFVDRAHLTDRGNRIAADIIKEKVLK